MLLEGAALRVGAATARTREQMARCMSKVPRVLEKWCGYGVGKMSGTVLAQALCGAMLRRDEYPSYLRARWADIGGIVPPARRETLTGVTETVTTGQKKTERVQIGNAASDCRNRLKTLEVEEPNMVEIENSKSASTSGPYPEAKMVEETKALEKAMLESGSAEDWTIAFWRGHGHAGGQNV